MSTPQLQTWAGEFGDAYTDRNVSDPSERLPAFAAMLAGTGVRSVLEVGCNRGHNLSTLAGLLGPDAEIVGVEPNAYARSLAARDARVTALAGSAASLPFPDGSFDLVFTVGVLIHVPPEQLDASLREIVRVSSRYVLAAEYLAESDTPIAYRDREELLWKRDFGAHYRRVHPDLELVRDGFWDREHGFDRCTWWLFGK